MSSQNSTSPDASVTTVLLEDQHTGKSPNSRTSPPRWSLELKARLLRFLARIGFYLHNFPDPSPPAPSFLRRCPLIALDGTKRDAVSYGSIELAFYVPRDYCKHIQQGHKYPVVINYHGGGFTMGTTTDDARWAAAVVKNVSAVVVSVAYRLAPEHPFPTAVEDSVCALLCIASFAGSLGVDASKITLSGFSAGGNLAFAVPLRLQAFLRHLNEERQEAQGTVRDTIPKLRIAAIVAWYPSLDNRITRCQRRESSLKPLKTLPRILTDLFDASYFPNADDVLSPYASPAAASDETLKTALPDDVAMYLCEWDMLLQEGKEFAVRLRNLGKRAACEVIEERMHGFDKSPWPFKLDFKVTQYYQKACYWLGEAYTNE